MYLVVQNKSKQTFHLEQEQECHIKWVIISHKLSNKMNKSIIKGRVFYNLGHAQATTLFIQLVCLKKQSENHADDSCGKFAFENFPVSIQNLYRWEFSFVSSLCIYYSFVFASTTHISVITHDSFFENRMITLLQLYSYTKVSRITDAQNLWKMSADVHRKHWIQFEHVTCCLAWQFYFWLNTQVIY